MLGTEDAKRTQMTCPWGAHSLWPKPGMEGQGQWWGKDTRGGWEGQKPGKASAQGVSGYRADVQDLEPTGQRD